MPPWKTLCLAGLLPLACDFGSESGSASRRLWRIPIRIDTLAVWKSDSVAFAAEGDTLRMYRFWNGCYRRFTDMKATEFLGSTTYAAEVVEGEGGDSLRMTYLVDSLRTATFGEIPGACVSDGPIGKVTVERNDFDVAAFFGPGDSLRATLHYEYAPEAGEDREYFLRIAFKEGPGAALDLSRKARLASPKGTARLAVAAEELPPRWKDGQSIGYAIHISFTRGPNREDHILTWPYRPVEAAYRPDP